MLTKAQAIELFGSVERLRSALGLKTKHAIYMWRADRIPERHFLRIRHELKPEAFDASGNLKEHNNS